ncbi:MAG TPA: hypothetical protein ENK85_10170 [Saprospiraceae bacterium]|nr:hypothetical protein [Saprospiraceae bacterium]
MRIWSLHPKYLDSKGLVALWRETLLAKKVLEDRTKGYKNHPQLIRFKNVHQPLSAINWYLKYVYDEAQIRGFHFDNSKFEVAHKIEKLSVTYGQMEFETQHLLTKLKNRDLKKYNQVIHFRSLEPHPLFFAKEGPIALWEKIN